MVARLLEVKKKKKEEEEGAHAEEGSSGMGCEGWSRCRQFENELRCRCVYVLTSSLFLMLALLA